MFRPMENTYFLKWVSWFRNGYLFEMPSGKLIKKFRLSDYGEDGYIKFLTDSTIVVGYTFCVPGTYSAEDPRREYWIILYNINQEKVIDTIYAKARKCPKIQYLPNKPYTPPYCPPIGPRCGDYWTVRYCRAQIYHIKDREVYFICIYTPRIHRQRRSGSATMVQIV